VRAIDRLLDEHTEGEIAGILNARHFVSGEGKAFHRLIVERVRREYHLESRYQRLREKGMLTLEEIACILGVATATVKHWRNHGLLRAQRYNDKSECVYEHPGERPPAKSQGRKLSERRRFSQVLTDHAKEVQCEA